MSKIRELRKGLGLSISQLSQQARINASTLSWAELGKIAVSPAFRSSLARFYDVSEEILFYDSGLAK